MRLAALLLVLAGCAHAAPLAPPPATAEQVRKAREQACVEVQERLIGLYADEYLRSIGEEPDPVTRHVFEQMWGEELEKRGSLDRFMDACLAGITPGKFACVERAQSADAAVDCIRTED